MSAARKDKEGGRIAVWIGLALFSLLFLLAAYRSCEAALRRFGLDFFYPYLAVKSVAARLSDATLLIYDRRELAGRLETLLAQNRALAAQSAASSSIAQQNEELRRLLLLTPPPQWRYRAAEIIRRDPLYWLQRFTIDCGEKQGVRPGSAVFTVSPQGLPILVGVVSHCGKHASQVTTSYGGELRLSGALERGGLEGMLNSDASGIPEGFMRLGFLPISGDCAVDDAVTTTGLESHVPPGLKIGNIVAVEGAESAYSERMFLSALVRPAADLNTIRFVMVATRIGEPPEQ